MDNMRATKVIATDDIFVLIDKQVKKIIRIKNDWKIIFTDGGEILVDSSVSLATIVIAVFVNANLKGIPNGFGGLLTLLERNDILSIVINCDKQIIQINVTLTDGSKQCLSLCRNQQVLSESYSLSEFFNEIGPNIQRFATGRSLAPLPRQLFIERVHNICQMIRNGATLDEISLMPPLLITIGITDLCNSKCEMCFRVRGGYIPGKFIFPDNILRNFVLDMATMGVKGLRFCGEGENMLHPKFLETLMLAKVVGLRTFIITNGTMLESSFHVVARCTDYLRVSFNALTPESYCRVHGISNKETYFQVLNGLKNVRIEKNALNNQLPIISMSCVIIKDNIDEALDGCLVQDLQNVCLDFIVLKSDRLWDMTPSDKGKYFEIIKHFQDASIRVTDYSGYSSPITIATRDWEEKLRLGCAVRFMRANVDRFDVHSCVTRHDIYGVITQQRLPMIWSSNQRIVLQRQRAKSKLANCDRCFWGDFHRIMNFLFEQEMTKSK